MRRSVYVEGLSERAAARRFGLARETVRKMLRYRVYRHHGYFAPETAEELSAEVANEETPAAQQILGRFVGRYRS